jgi:hypothetical protein
VGHPRNKEIKMFQRRGKVMKAMNEQPKMPPTTDE